MIIIIVHIIVYGLIKSTYFLEVLELKSHTHSVEVLSSKYVIELTAFLQF